MCNAPNASEFSVVGFNSENILEVSLLIGVEVALGQFVQVNIDFTGVELTFETEFPLELIESSESNTRFPVPKMLVLDPCKLSCDADEKPRSRD